MWPETDWASPDGKGVKSALAAETTDDRPKEKAAHGEQRRTIRLFGRSVRMPRSRNQRIAIGVALVVLGCFGFLPILGFWMIPLGLVVLSYEFATIRRWRRNVAVWWGRRRMAAKRKRA
jgi:hypothetical protein